MNVETFLICDSVQTLSTGKHIIQGERHEFVVNKVPTKIQPISMAVYVSLAKGEQGKHRIGFTIKSDHGENACDDYELVVGFTGDYYSFVYEDILHFASTGRYVAQLIIDDIAVAKWPFVVKLLQ